MKKKAVILLCALFLAVEAQEVPRFEVGVLIGEPTSLSIKWWYGKRSAFDAAVLRCSSSYSAIMDLPDADNQE